MVPGDAELSSRLREQVRQGREHMRSVLLAGAPGREACRSMSDLYDGIVTRLWARAHEEVPKAARAPLALVATGGWGRREVCPYSDIDFLLLARARDGELAREVTDALLYPLWDAQIRVGHAVRDVASAARLAREDLPTATALLDARHIAGDAELTGDLLRATRRSIAPGGNANRFVIRLRDEQRRRHDRFGDSLYLLEPNLKQGIGALRDLATAIWGARARWSIRDLSELVALGELTARQRDVLDQGLDFLLGLRSLIQLEVDRATDQLTFEVQEALAPKLFPEGLAAVERLEGDVRPAVAPAVEQLMRQYYLHGRGIARVTERLLESATVAARRRPTIMRVDGSFLLWNGKLALTDPAILRDNPAEMVRFFRVAQEQDVPLYGHTKELIEATVAREPGLLVENRRAAELFLAALVDERDARQPSLLEEMHQVGVLSAVLPEFGPCTGRVQHDLYHVYTVDQHQLYAVALLKRCARGELADEAPVATSAYARVERFASLYLATLLHDVGKPMGKGHAEKGARLATAVARRLGMSDEDVGRVDLLVREHLTMAHVSQRRDLSDSRVVEKFAQRVGDIETATQLFLLTRCDTAMTAPGNLSSWKDQLLSELYQRTLEYFEGAGMTGELALHRRQARRRAVEIVSERGDDLQRAARAETLVSQLDASFVNNVNARQLASMVELALELQDADRPIDLRVEHRAGQSHTVVSIAARDTPALLSDIAGILAAHRVYIDSAVLASVATTRGGLALDLFRVRDPLGQAIPEDDARWSRVRRSFESWSKAEDRHGMVSALLREKRAPSSFRPRITSAVPTDIKVHDDVSDHYTVIEVFTEDRPGLLHIISRILAGHGLDIHQSMVNTEGEKASDAFYVQKIGRKISADEAQRLVEALRLRLLADGEVDA